jgi:hypothetical protein
MYGLKSTVHIASKAWNSLSDDTRSTNNKNIFRRAVRSTLNFKYTFLQQLSSAFSTLHIYITYLYIRLLYMIIITIVIHIYIFFSLSYIYLRYFLGPLVCIC